MKSKLFWITGSIIMIAVLGFATYTVVISTANNAASKGPQAEPPDPSNKSELSEGTIDPDVLDEFGIGQIYETEYDFPYDDMSFANDEVFELLKEAFGKAEYYGEFEKGITDEYNYYLEKYYQLLNSEISFIDLETGEEFYLNEFELLTGYMEANKIDAGHLNHWTFYFFDMDEDGAPELCKSGDYVFKFDPEVDRCILWGGHRGNNYYSIRGSRKMTWDHSSGFGEKYRFEQLDEKGRVEYTTYFYQHYKPHQETDELEIFYVVELPLYANKGLTKEIVNQAYPCYADENKDKVMYYFRVTEEQYAELTTDYFLAAESAEEKIKDVSYTYDELFGRFSQTATMR